MDLRVSQHAEADIKVDLLKIVKLFPTTPKESNITMITLGFILT